MNFFVSDFEKNFSQSLSNEKHLKESQVKVGNIFHGFDALPFSQKPPRHPERWVGLMDQSQRYHHVVARRRLQIPSPKK